MNANTTEKMRKMKFYGMLHAFKMNLNSILPMRWWHI
jgi:hypothetical protein